MTSKHYLALSISALLATQTWANTAATGNAVAMPTIYLQQKALIELEQHSQTVSRKDLDQAQAEDLKSMLRYEPGVEVESQSGLGNGNLNIRGISDDRVLAMVDGLSLPDAFKDSFWYGGSSARAKNGMTFGQNLVEADTIRQINVVKGPFDARYGSDAMGGAVNMRTVEVHDLLLNDHNAGVLQKFAFNSGNKGWSSTTGVAAQNQHAEGLLMYTHRDYEETQTAGPQANRQDNQAQNILAKAKLQHDQHQWRVMFEQFERDGSSTDLISVGSFDDTASERRRGSLEYQYTPTQNTALTWLKVGLDAQQLNSKMQQIEPKAALQERHLQGYNQDLERAYMEAAWHVAAWGQHHIVAGTEYKQVETSTNRHSAQYDTQGIIQTEVDDKLYYPDQTRKIWSAYIRDRWAFENGLSILPGLRYTHEKSTPDATDFPRLKNQAGKDFEDMVAQKSYAQLSPSLTLSQALNQHHQIFASYARGFKTPQFDAQGAASHSVLGGAIQYYNVPNPDLKPEQSDNFELGWLHAGDKVQAKVTAFYNRYKNFIEEGQTVRTQAPAGGRPTVNDPMIMELSAVNLDRVETYGLEASGQYSISPVFNINGSVFWMRGINTEDDSHMNSELPLKVRLGAEYTQERWGSFAHWTLSDDKSDYSTSHATTPKTPGYALLDIGGFWQIHPQARLNVNVHNVLDKMYWLSNDMLWLNTTGQMQYKDHYSQMGRAFSAALELKF